MWSCISAYELKHRTGGRWSVGSNNDSRRAETTDLSELPLPREANCHAVAELLVNSQHS
ncbi:hypothetical protein WOLCODRAFT_24674, partial [Wolfiporia cocos MD-104 SS10]